MPKRILINASAAYVRSLLAAGLALFSGRWVLEALGATDFGLFYVVGAVIVFITFLNSLMAASAARQLSFAIGQGEPEGAGKWFNTALCAHLLLPVVLVLVGLPIGEYCIRNVLEIPPDRVGACVWVFRLSLVTAFVNMASVPYLAVFNARQQLSEPAAWGMLLSVYQFALAYALTRIEGDLLLVYAGFGMLGHVMFTAVQVLRARALFPECRCRLEHWFHAGRLRTLLSFASWTLFGSLGYLLRTQGSSILLNLVCGAKVNAAYGIGVTVSQQASNLSMALRSALAPEITAREGRGERQRVISLALRACKFSTLLILLFAIPLLLEMETVLRLWLRTPPAHTTVFCRLMLCELLVDALTIGHILAINAVGRVAAYNLVLGALHALALPLAWWLLRLGHPPGAVGVAALAASVLLLGGRLWFVRRLLDLPVRAWVGGVFLPCLTAGLSATGAGALWLVWMEPTPWRLAASATTSVTVLVLIAWRVALNTEERDVILRKLSARLPARLGGDPDAKKSRGSLPND